MKLRISSLTLLGTLWLSTTSPAGRGEEQHALMTALSQTTISGVVDTSAIWSFGTPAETILFQDNFDSDSSANWNVFAGSPSGTEDYTVEWAFDYSTNRYTSMGVTTNIPPAPGSSGTTRGVKLTVNHNDEVAEMAAVNLYPKDKTFSGNFALRFDLWINYNGPAGGGTGSTEHTLFGINHAGDKVNWAHSSASPSDGIFFAVTGEGGSGAVTPDYINYEGDPSGSPLRFTDQEGGFLDRNGNGTFEDEVPSNPELNLLFPAPPFETAGAPGKQWVQVEVRQREGVVTWLINGYVIAEKTSGLGWTTGNIMIGLMDIFNSIANPRADNFVIFDNLRVVDLSTRPAPARVTLAAGNNAGEPSTSGGFRLTRTGDTSQALAVNLRLRGTATAGQDYAAIPLSTNFSAGVSTLDIPVTIINDQRAEAVETVLLDIVSNAGQYEVFAPMTASIEVADDNDITTVTVTAVDPYSYEKIRDDVGAFQISRVGDTSSDLTVNFTVGGTAQAGTDYQNPGASVIIPAGADSAVVRVIPVDNSVTNADKTVSLNLASGTGYSLGSSTNGTVTIRNDDDGIVPGPVVFSDNFDSDTTAQWTVNEAHADLNRATFNWDYSSVGIPAAPNTTNGSTRGLRLEANIGDVGTFTGLSVSPNDFGIEGDYRLKFDVWMNYNGPLAAGGAGSTMSFAAGVGTSGTVAQFPGTSVEGVLFSVTGDGGSGSDWRAYVAAGAPLAGDTGAYAAGTNATVQNNTNPYYSVFGRATAPEAQQALFPEQEEAVSTGAPGMAWHEMIIEKRGSNITWTLDNLRIATITITNKEISTNILVGFFDINAGNTGNRDLRFGLVDNLRVERLEVTQPAGEIRITSVSRSGTDLVIEFRAPANVTTPVLYGATGVAGPYAPESVQPQQLATNTDGTRTWRATVPIVGFPAPNRFFVVRNQPL